MLATKRIRKQSANLLSFILLIYFFVTNCFIPVYGEIESKGDVQTKEIEQLGITSPSVVLMEASTGQVILQTDARERRSPASITKIMTLFLIFDEIKAGRLHLDDKVMTSAYAKSMGGSQVFLEEGEMQTVETLIKCIVIASGNDASVALAEHISGSEEAFVSRMNQKAEELGLKDTHFIDCCGLTDSDEHYSSALDVALMSRALIINHPEIFRYSKIWMEDMTHETAKGSTTFTLSSTNKLLKQYEYATGLKTGSTSKAKYCFAGTACKNNIDLIAVIMACPDPKARFWEAKKLLEYGFSIASIYEDKNDKPLPDCKVVGGKVESAKIKYEDSFRYLDLTGADLSRVEKEVNMDDRILAPERKGAEIGKALYRLGEKELGYVRILLDEDIEKATYGDALKKVMYKMLL